MRYQLIDQYYQGKEYYQKLSLRANYLSLLEKSPVNRARYVLEDFSVNPITFIETFGFIKIPEYQNSIKPFFLFPYQKEIIMRLQSAEQDSNEHEILLDKPRGMGLTWAIVWYLIWRWCFTPNWSGFILSRSELEVDDGTASPDSSIFGKLRWSLGKLPAWIKPEGFRPKGNKGTAHDMGLRISNPQIGSSLVGSTTNANAGRSRRYSFTFIDECFAIERFSEVWRSLQSVSRTKLFISTVRQGKIFRDFKDYCESKGDYVSLKWQDHPFKDQIWYDEQVIKAEVDPEVMKEVDVDYMVNIKSQYYPEIVEAKVQENLQYSRKLPLYISLDFGSQDRTVIIYYQFDGKYIYILECYSSSRKPLEWYVPFLNWKENELNPEKYSDFQKALVNKLSTWEKPIAYFGEVAHYQKVMPLNRSIADELHKYGVRLRANNYGIEHATRRHATSSLLPRMIFNSSSSYVMELYDAIANSRYTNSVKSVNKQTSLKPVHDSEIADYRAALENFAVNFPIIAKKQRGELERDSDGRVDSVVKSLVSYLKV